MNQLKSYTLYNYTLKSGIGTVGLDRNGVGGEFFHLDFMATLNLFAVKFLGDSTCHDLLKAFRQIEKIVLFSRERKHKGVEVPLKL